MLEDYPKTVVTKSGLSIQLRPVVPEDEDNLRRLVSQIPDQEKWFLRDNLSDPEMLHKWIRNLNYDRTLPIIAVKADDGEAIGNLRLYRSCSECTKHVAHIRVMVHPEYRSQHVGSWLILDCSKLAADLGIEKLVAEFVAGWEDVAIMAAKRLDFHHEAVLKDYVRDPDGTYRDLIIMVKTISKEWFDF
jgi:RimJ/RimL family protein N-acetyltransferase